MTELDSKRLISRDNLTFHVDYVCLLEYRNGEAVVNMKNSCYSKTKMSKEEFISIQKEFFEKGRKKNGEPNGLPHDLDFI